MELYIRTLDGLPHEHPILGDNLREAYPWLDLDNLPAGFARFERVPPPEVGVFEVLQGPVYVFDGDVVKDTWTVRPMSESEQLVRIEEERESIRRSIAMFSKYPESTMRSQIIADLQARLDAPNPFLIESTLP